MDDSTLRHMCKLCHYRAYTVFVSCVLFCILLPFYFGEINIIHKLMTSQPLAGRLTWELCIAVPPQYGNEMSKNL
jgi:hypothetical protein